VLVRISVVVIMAFGLVLGFGCVNDSATVDTAPTLRRFSYARMQMGVRSEITLYSSDERAARDAAAAAFDEINRLEAIFSDYRPASEVSRLSGPGLSGPASPELIDILTTATEVSGVSDGAFDVTVGVASRAWREARRLGVLPNNASLAAIRATIGWRGVRLEPPRVTLATPDTRVDLGGIAKGYAAWRALGVLRGRGVASAMVAIAGDVAVGEPPPGEPGWHVAITDGRPASAPTRTLVMRNAAVSTSGDAAQFVEIGGVRYAHILDPRTGLGATLQRSATVVSRDPDRAGELADSLSTAVFLLGEQGGRWLAERFGVGVILIEEGREVVVDPDRLIGK
jgi:thiamine biosynthesis lipoprotein